MSSERRSYFRIDETIAIEYKMVDEITANTAIPELQFPDAGSLKLFSELRRIDSDNQHILPQIKETHRALGEYLHNLNHKIDIISQQILADSKPIPLSKTIKQVNLSEGGLAFGSSDPLQADGYAAMRLVFLPSNSGLVVFAKIIRCDPSPDPKSSGEYHIAAKFHRITDAQQQLVGQQIMRTQMAERRRNAKNLQ